MMVKARLVLRIFLKFSILEDIHGRLLHLIRKMCSMTILHCHCRRLVARLWDKQSALLCFARRLWADEAGITALKFNLVFLAILVVITGGIEVGRLLIAQGALAHAASDESRNGPSDDGADNAASVQRIGLDAPSPNSDARPRRVP